MSQFELAHCYAVGFGVEMDVAESLKWLKCAATNGNAMAQAQLGSCYANGNGVAKDLAIGLMWLRKAADQGEPSALYNLALMYARGNGNGVGKDEDEAYRLLRLSAEQGFELAMKIVGDI